MIKNLIDLAESGIMPDFLIRSGIRRMQKIAKGQFSVETMNDIKRKFMVTYYQQCLNTDFYTDFYGTQLL